MCTIQDGIQPMWEDVRNKSGGRWLFNLDKRDRKDVLDQCWLETVRMGGSCTDTFHTVHACSPGVL